MIHCVTKPLWSFARPCSPCNFLFNFPSTVQDLSQADGVWQTCSERFPADVMFVLDPQSLGPTRLNISKKLLMSKHFPSFVSGPMSRVCRNSYPIFDSASGYAVKRLSACTRMPHKNSNSMKGPPLFTFFALTYPNVKQNLCLRVFSEDSLHFFVWYWVTIDEH